MNSQHNSIPEEPERVLEQKEEYTDGRERGDNDCISPFRIGADVRFSRIIEIVAVESRDCDGEDELQDADGEAYVSSKRGPVLE